MLVFKNKMLVNKTSPLRRRRLHSRPFSTNQQRHINSAPTCSKWLMTDWFLLFIPPQLRPTPTLSVLHLQSC